MIDASEGINVNLTNETCKFIYLCRIKLRLKPKLCDGCHYLMQNTMGFTDFVIVSIREMIA